MEIVIVVDSCAPMDQRRRQRIPLPDGALPYLTRLAIEVDGNVIGAIRLTADDFATDDLDAAEVWRDRFS